MLGFSAVTRRRQEDFKRQASSRNVLRCCVFGHEHSGKTCFINRLIKKEEIEISPLIDRHTCISKIRLGTALLVYHLWFIIFSLSSVFCIVEWRKEFAAKIFIRNTLNRVNRIQINLLHQAHPYGSSPILIFRQRILGSYSILQDLGPSFIVALGLESMTRATS